MATDKVEIAIDLDYLHSINALFGSFLSQNLEVLKDNTKNISEVDASFPMFSFTIFLFELEKEINKNE